MWNLSEEKFWTKIHKEKSVNFHKYFTFFIWLQNYTYFKIIEKYISSKYKNIFEIWCAPWNYLIKFNKKYWLNPNWIEYTKNWFEKTVNNLKINNIKWDIIHCDFFNKNFIDNNINKYDVVYSIWFIEHFDNPELAIENHFKIAKDWWLVIISLPNLRYLNNYFFNNDILNMHNLKIMDLEELKKYFSKYSIQVLKYNWWLFNFGLFYYSNPIVESIRLLLFVIQRLIIDPIFILFYKLWIDLSNKYTSPQILVVCKK